MRCANGFSARDDPYDEKQPVTPIPLNHVTVSFKRKL